jgi:hypothetical protein
VALGRVAVFLTLLPVIVLPVVISTVPNGVPDDGLLIIVCKAGYPVAMCGIPAGILELLTFLWAPSRSSSAA